MLESSFAQNEFLTGGQRSMRILLVEDDHFFSQSLARGLREQAYAVDAVANGAAALYQASISDYDLIILDVMIPEPDGYAVCRELRVSGARIPVLMLTARDAVDDRITGLDSGADDYLTKPFDFGELLARIRALLRRGHEIADTIIRVDDLCINARDRSAERDGVRFSLTNKEYSLLEYLGRNAGRVVGRAEIAEHVWEEDFDPFSNVIETYINRLRRKIDRAGKKPLLRTRRGAGYMLSAHDEAMPGEEQS